MRDFPRIRLSEFRCSRVDEDTKLFFNEVYNVLNIMGVTLLEKGNRVLVNLVMLPKYGSTNGKKIGSKMRVFLIGKSPRFLSLIVSFPFR